VTAVTDPPKLTEGIPDERNRNRPRHRLAVAKDRSPNARPELELTMIKKTALGLILLVGLYWLVSTFALGFPEKTKAVDGLTDDFRPVFADKGLNQSESDIDTINKFAAEFQTEAVPALAKQLGVTPEQFVEIVSKQYPDVGAGVRELPTSLPYFNGMVSGLGQEQSNFQKADSIPTSFLPAQSVHWLFVMLGVVTIAIAGLGLAKPTRSTAFLGAAAGLGVAVIGVTLILSVPAKAEAVDGMTNEFRPIFTEKGAAQTRDYLTTVEKMNTELTTEALPGLAKMLKVTPQELGASLGQNFPDVGSGLQQMPQILARFDDLVTKIEANVANFQKADSIPTTTSPTTKLQGQFLYPSLLLIIAGGGAALGAGRRRSKEPVEAQLREELEPSSR
jgi:hypothetical protein